MAKHVLVTGAAGFIGSQLAEALLARGDTVVGLDNFNDYYDPGRKRLNRAEVERGLTRPEGCRFVEGDVRDRGLLGQLFAERPFDAIVHLAAMAGVRASIVDPALYYDVNLNGTLALLDAAVGRLALGRARAAARLPTLVFASTSSVYGATRQIPFVESDPCDTPLAPYAASKRAGEMLCYTYHHLYELPVTVFRFFTVYGPRNRPDMMAYKVADSIDSGREVPLFNEGQMHRDWTFVGDVVQGLVAAVDRPLGFEILNLGRGEPVLLADFVRLIEAGLGRKAHLVPAPAPDTDVAYTYADISKTRRLLGYQPTTSVRDGVAQFLSWYERAVRSPAAGA